METLGEILSFAIFLALFAYLSHYIHQKDKKLQEAISSYGKSQNLNLFHYAKLSNGIAALDDNTPLICWMHKKDKSTKTFKPADIRKVSSEFHKSGSGATWGKIVLLTNSAQNPTFELDFENRSAECEDFYNRIQILFNLR